MNADDALDATVAALMRRVAAERIMPRFRNLAVGEVKAKGAPDDLVTVADRESEAVLTQGLAALDPGARVVGEEAVAADPDLLDDLGSGRVWLVDPLDGTGNFADGRTPFGVLVALIDEGEPIAGWMLDPVADRLCRARRGRGAFVDDERVRSGGTGEAVPIAALSTFLPEPGRTALADRAAGAFALVDMPRCAAEMYPRLGLGGVDAVLYHRTLPWDHAAGVLWLEEAGGVARRPDGSRYRLDDHRPGLLAAATPELWYRAALAFGFPQE